MKNYAFLILAMMATQYIFSQGCSDAGICSIAKPQDSISAKLKNEIEISGNVGAGQADTQYFSPLLSYTRHFNDRISAAVKITGSVAKGRFGTRGSIGDAYLSLILHPRGKNKWKWGYTAAIKIPFNRANLKINNHPLPLDYQASLGTFDMLAGANLSFRQWEFSGALQIPVININANSYFSEYSGTNDFPTTNLFERKPDALLRAMYTIKTANRRFIFKPNVLAIYHLGKDTYENISGNRLSIDGSEGLTINGNLIAFYNLKTGYVSLSVAAPFVVRDVRADGLTRAYTIALGYTTNL